jgi:hypothetical protein
MLTAAAPTSQVADSFSLWSEWFDREMQDVFAIHDDIARAIMAALKLRLAGRSCSNRHRNPIIFLPDEQRPGDPRRLVGDGNRDETGWFLLEQRVDPSGADRTLLAGIADHRRGSDDNERT